VTRRQLEWYGTLQQSAPHAPRHGLVFCALVGVDGARVLLHLMVGVRKVLNRLPVEQRVRDASRLSLLWQSGCMEHDFLRLKGRVNMLLW
jgi:hypothetical protein